MSMGEIVGNEAQSAGFWNKLSQLFGYSVGKIFGAVFNLGLLPITAPIIGKAFARSSKNAGNLQEKRNYQ